MDYLALHNAMFDEPDFESHKVAVRKYLEEQLELVESNKRNPQEAAYEIAGLMSTNAVASLADENPYLKVMLMAGDLELPSVHRSDDSTWVAMRALISNLD